MKFVNIKMLSDLKNIILQYIDLEDLLIYFEGNTVNKLIQEYKLPTITKAIKQNHFLTLKYLISLDDVLDTSDYNLACKLSYTYGDEIFDYIKSKYYVDREANYYY